MRLLLVIVIAAGMALYWGATNLWVAMSDRSPTEISCADYAKHRPDAKWLRLTHCEADLENMAVMQDKSNKISAVYIPLRAEGTTGGQTTVVIKRTDDDMLELAGKLDAKDLPQPLAGRIMKQLEEPTEGLAEFGLDMEDKDNKRLQGLGLGLANDFVVIARGKEPRVLLPLVAFVLGLGGIGWMLRALWRRFHPAPA
jgi:hypothetical protein